MAALSIRNMNWTVGMRELIVEDQLSERKRVNVLAQDVRVLMTQAEFNAWWETLPNDNAGYVKAVEAKHAELVGGARGLSMTTSVTRNGGL